MHILTIKNTKTSKPQIACFARMTLLCYVSNFQPHKLKPANPGKILDPHLCPPNVFFEKSNRNRRQVEHVESMLSIDTCTVQQSKFWRFSINIWFGRSFFSRLSWQFSLGEKSPWSIIKL